ncbi:hypothetical protein ALP66_101788 [Pseudomonas amygdali pv. photiniae]|uniref:Uncharacterized protein n=4 Tax=Pseudomonas syringae group TaxID=136849 RepID=A0A3M6AUH3_PSESS|nr:hypothetical protein ALO74_101590 [Pseudomonas syringae pv. cunninghamiae]KPX12057.1 hypothetical protein ALO73_101655 [Pseudomonas syringae pv. daphniphylli]KPX19623.1 hypothetical protein ALO71_101551 [Pseudomonas amygdali pv. dendropanacis]KPX60749.1 hypothetical protein ALO53_101674 [Pseudomonas amygdali pv. photiniae]RMO96751.1 hypothetical protein ALQ31_100310 [Pseudomonas amygdali pv. morsprunorum]RMV09296.1 hypothetical protein ALP17_106395 [Pseudomonas savastanoi]
MKAVVPVSSALAVNDVPLIPGYGLTPADGIIIDATPLNLLGL